MVRQIAGTISILVLALPCAVATDVASAEAPVGFPSEACTCIVEFDDAGPLFEAWRSDRSLEPLLVLLGVAPAAGMLEGRSLTDQGKLYAALLADGTIGARTDQGTGGIEWIAWIGPGSKSARALMASLGPVRVLDRLVHPELSIALAEVGTGILVSSEPPGGLRALALRRIAQGDPAERCSARAALDPDAPLVITFKHEPPLGGSSAVAVDLKKDSVELEYRGRFEQRVVRPPACNRTLDIEVLERMPEDVIAVMVEHSDAGIIPGEEFISQLLPHLVEPEPSDERRLRRLLVISETQPEGGDAGELRLPAIAVAIEVDGPGASVRRQDLAVLASLNTLRNRFGTNAGLQHLPSLEALPENGTRTVYTSALLDPAFAGHPMARCVSANWCLTKGPKNWQLYATTPDLAKRVALCLESPEGELACVSAAHAGRLDTDRAVAHLRSWGRMAEAFVAKSRRVEFASAIEMLTEMLQGVESLDWTITVPDEQSLDAVVRLRDRTTETTLR